MEILTPEMHSFLVKEPMIIFKGVFIPKERIFMDGEVEYASMLVERFTCYHSRTRL